MVKRPYTRGHQDSEDRLDLLGGIEVALLAEGIPRPPVVTIRRIVERRLHEAVEGNGAVAVNLVAQQFGERGHGSTTRVCGVRMNISIR